MAAIIAHSCQTEHKVELRFNDRDYGRWTGQTKTDVIAQGGTVDAASDVEPTSSIPSRAHPALHAWAEQAQACDQTQIVVTHDAMISPVSMPSGSDRNTITPSPRSEVPIADGLHDSAARGQTVDTNHNDGIALPVSRSVRPTAFEPATT